MRAVRGWAQADKLEAAKFNVVHLIAAVSKLRPGWLPKPLFDLLHKRWLSPERRARCPHFENSLAWLPVSPGAASHSMPLCAS